MTSIEVDVASCSIVSCFRKETLPLRAILGHSWGHVEGSSGVFGPSWSFLGASWGGLGGFLGDLEASGRILGPLGVVLGLLKQSFG